uniref:Uncharacterized protein n=1 Tax=Branchiostoma floridae TaxID=7739 RepID=C3YVS2_BRAFL|eukprot:XP_002599594.1 hypothetical protein BRAFLDRAFT_77692 [Branchiostoma floridae]
MPQTRSSGPAADQTQPPPPKRTRKRKQPPSSSATPTLTTPSTTEFNAMKDQMNALTTATQSIQRSLAAILPPAATSQAPAGTSTTSPTGHPTLPPTLLDGATGTHADPLVAAILGNDLVNDKSKNTSTPDERTETITPRSPFLLSSPLTLPRLALAFTYPSTRAFQPQLQLNHVAKHPDGVLLSIPQTQRPVLQTLQALLFQMLGATQGASLYQKPLPLRPA